MSARSLDQLLAAGETPQSAGAALDRHDRTLPPHPKRTTEGMAAFIERRAELFAELAAISGWTGELQQRFAGAGVP